MRYKPPIPLKSIADFGLLKRFAKKVTVEPVTGCWLWCGSTNSKTGYPRLWWEGKNCLAHRLSHAMFVGPVPDGMTVDHACHRPGCVNPSHLELMTVSENSKERHARNGNGSSSRAHTASPT